MTLYDSLGLKCQDELWMMAGEIIENYSEMFGYINTGRVNIRIRSEDGPPNNPSGKQEVIWGGVVVKMEKRHAA